MTVEPPLTALKCKPMADEGVKADEDHLPGELDCRSLFRPLTSEVAGLSPFFARPFGSEMGARENALKRLFFPSG
jgi:hypothetical protein